MPGKSKKQSSEGGLFRIWNYRTRALLNQSGMARLGSPAAFLPSPLPPTLDGNQAADQMAPVTDLWFGSPSCTNTAGWHSTIADASGLQNDRVALPIQVWQCRGRGLVAHSNRELAMCVLSGCVERVPVQLIEPPQ